MKLGDVGRERVKNIDFWETHFLLKLLSELLGVLGIKPVEPLTFLFYLITIYIFGNVRRSLCNSDSDFQLSYYMQGSESCYMPWANFNEFTQSLTKYTVVRIFSWKGTNFNLSWITYSGNTTSIAIVEISIERSIRTSKDV